MKSGNMFKLSFSDMFPVFGGAIGAAEGAEKLPSIQSILVYIGMTILGALIGYAVKMFLDLIILKKKNAEMKRYLEDFDKPKNEKK